MVEKLIKAGCSVGKTYDHWRPQAQDPISQAAEMAVRVWVIKRDAEIRSPRANQVNATRTHAS